MSLRALLPPARPGWLRRGAPVGVRYFGTPAPCEAHTVTPRRSWWAVTLDNGERVSLREVGVDDRAVVYAAGRRGGPVGIASPAGGPVYQAAAAISALQSSATGLAEAIEQFHGSPTPNRGEKVVNASVAFVRARLERERLAGGAR